jgi:hypothetical protein
MAQAKSMELQRKIRYAGFMTTDKSIDPTDGAAWENYAAERLRAHHAAADRRTELVPAPADDEGDLGVDLFELSEDIGAAEADLLIDETALEALQATTPDIARRRWTPGFHAGAVEAELRLPGQAPRCFEIVSDPALRPTPGWSSCDRGSMNWKMSSPAQRRRRSRHHGRAHPRATAPQHEPHQGPSATPGRFTFADVRLTRGDFPPRQPLRRFIQPLTIHLRPQLQACSGGLTPFST